MIITSDGALPTRLSRGAGLNPYLVVVIHPRRPELLPATGRQTAAHKGYIAKCPDYLSDTDGTRIEARSRTQMYFNDHSRIGKPRRDRYWRRVGRRIASAFQISALDDD